MSKNHFKSVLNVFDIFSINFHLRIFGEENYKSKSGTFLGFVTIVAIMAFSGIFIIELFMRKNFSIIYNTNTNLIPRIDLTNTPIMFFISDKQGKRIPKDGIYNIEVKLIKYPSDKLSNKLIYSNIEFEQCNKEKHKLFGEITTYPDFSENLCISPGKQEKILFGQWKDVQKGFSGLTFFINKCNPASEKCREESEIEKYLYDFVVGVYYNSYNIDHYNYNSPKVMKYQSNGNFAMSNTLLKYYYLNLSQVFYETDYGLIFEEKSLEDFYVFESQKIDINLQPKTSNSNVSLYTLGNIILTCSENISFYHRSYGKAQTVIANIGGLIKIILILSKLLFEFFTRKILIVDLSNNFFKLSDVQEEKNDNKDNKQKLNSNLPITKEIINNNFAPNKLYIAKNERDRLRINKYLSSIFDIKFDFLNLKFEFLKRD